MKMNVEYNPLYNNLIAADYLLSVTPPVMDVSSFLVQDLITITTNDCLKSALLQQISYKITLVTLCS